MRRCEFGHANADGAAVCVVCGSTSLTTSAAVGPLPPGWAPAPPGWAHRPPPPPPGQWAPPAAAPSYTAPRALSLAVRWGFAVIVGVGGAAVGSSLVAFRLADRLATSSGSVTFAQLDASDDRQLVFGIVQLVLQVAVGVLFILWVRRLYRNLAALGTHGLRYSPGWAVGAWFVPVLNLWRPKQIVDDIFRGSDPHRPPGASWQRAPVHPLLHVWWVLWIVGIVLSRLLGVSSETTDVDSLRSQQLLVLLGDLVYVTGAILASWVVVTLTARHEARAASVGVPGAPRTAAPPGVEHPPAAPPGAAPPDRTRLGARVGWLLPVAALVTFGITYALADGGADGGVADSPRSDDGGLIPRVDVDVGDCVDGIQEGIVEDLDVVPCASAHDGEVFATDAFGEGLDAAWPGDDEASVTASDLCLPAFEDYVGASYEESELDFWYFAPTELTWQLGDREVVCILTSIDLSPLEGVMRGSGE